MDLQFEEPTVSWRQPKQPNAEVAPTTVPDSVVSVSFPIRDQKTQQIRSHVERLPCQFTLSPDDENALLKHPVKFKLMADGQEVASYTTSLGECILEDALIEWSGLVSSTKQEVEVHVTIPTHASHHPREAMRPTP